VILIPIGFRSLSYAAGSKKTCVCAAQITANESAGFSVIPALGYAQKSANKCELQNCVQRCSSRTVAATCPLAHSKATISPKARTRRSFVAARRMRRSTEWANRCSSGQFCTINEASYLGIFEQCTDLLRPQFGDLRRFQLDRTQDIEDAPKSQSQSRSHRRKNQLR
jgi:hypothetical protein